MIDNLSNKEHTSLLGLPKIVISEEVVNAGILELFEYGYGSDMRVVVAEIYQVMAYTLLQPQKFDSLNTKKVV